MITGELTRFNWRDILELRVEAGARNLLVECAQLGSGDGLLLVHEEAGRGYYDDQLVSVVADGAKRLGIDVELLECPFDPWATVVPSIVKEKMRSGVTTIFFARIGDQLRFSDLGSDGKAVVSYVLDTQMLGSSFGTASYETFVKLKAAIDKLVLGAGEIAISCPKGTDCIGTPPQIFGGRGDVSISRFPLSIFSPVSAMQFTGKVALPGFLVGTGSIYYRPYAVELSSPLFAQFEDGRLTGFEGDVSAVKVANDHYDFVSQKFAIDRDCVHSWHCGIHPGCRFPNKASDDYERWSGSAFGNPRLLHFHTCGAYAPGEVSWNVVDPTVCIDGVNIWEAGVLNVSKVPGCDELLAGNEEIATLFRFPETAIGL